MAEEFGEARAKAERRLRKEARAKEMRASRRAGEWTLTDETGWLAPRGGLGLWEALNMIRRLADGDQRRRAAARHARRVAVLDLFGEPAPPVPDGAILTDDHVSKDVLQTMAIYVADHDLSGLKETRDVTHGYRQLIDAVDRIHARWGCDPDPDCGPRHREEAERFMRLAAEGRLR